MSLHSILDDIGAISSKYNDEPEKSIRPFDKNRDGVVVGEGGGVLVVEALDCALKRGAKIYCEIVGYKAMSDSYDLMEPDPKDKGILKCIIRCLA